MQDNVHARLSFVSLKPWMACIKTLRSTRIVQDPSSSSFVGMNIVKQPDKLPPSPSSFFHKVLRCTPCNIVFTNVSISLRETSEYAYWISIARSATARAFLACFLTSKLLLGKQSSSEHNIAMITSIALFGGCRFEKLQCLIVQVKQIVTQIIFHKDRLDVLLKACFGTFGGRSNQNECQK